MENGEAFIFGRTDWQYVLNTFCFGYNVGYKFIKTKAGRLQRQLPRASARTTATRPWWWSSRARSAC